MPQANIYNTIILNLMHVTNLLNKSFFMQIPLKYGSHQKNNYMIKCLAAYVVFTNACMTVL